PPVVTDSSPPVVTPTVTGLNSATPPRSKELRKNLKEEVSSTTTARQGWNHGGVAVLVENDDNEGGAERVEQRSDVELEGPGGESTRVAGDASATDTSLSGCDTLVTEDAAVTPVCVYSPKCGRSTVPSCGHHRRWLVGGRCPVSGTPLSPLAV